MEIMLWKWGETASFIPFTVNRQTEGILFAELKQGHGRL